MKPKTPTDEQMAETSMLSITDMMRLFQIRSRSAMESANIPSAKLGGCRRYQRSRVEAFVFAHTLGRTHKLLPSKFLTPLDACAQLGIGHATLRAMRNSGQIGYLAINERVLRYDPREVKACIDRGMGESK